MISKLTTFLICMFGIAVALPHSGMIDNPEYRDVGVIFTEENYGGASSFLFEGKTTNKCFPLEQDGVPGAKVVSVQICYHTACVLFAGDGCNAESFTVKLDGEKNFTSIAVPEGQNNVFMSACCGEAAEKVNADVELAW